MIRNLKVLGLALVAVFALSAVVASAASAQQGTFTSDGSWTGSGAETGAEGSNAFTVLGLTTHCPGSTYSFHQFNETPHKLVPDNATSATVTPSYKQANHNCKASFGWTVTIDMNGCDYVVRLGATTGGVAGTYGMTFDIVCPANNEITITFFTNTTDETNGKVACMWHIKPQVNLPGLHATVVGSNHIGIHGTVEGMHATETSTGHTIICFQDETTTTGKIDLDITVSAKNSVGGSTPISLSHP